METFITKNTFHFVADGLERCATTSCRRRRRPRKLIVLKLKNQKVSLVSSFFSRLSHRFVCDRTPVNCWWMYIKWFWFVFDLIAPRTDTNKSTHWVANFLGGCYFRPRLNTEIIWLFIIILLLTEVKVCWINRLSLYWVYLPLLMDITWKECHADARRWRISFYTQNL